MRTLKLEIEWVRESSFAYGHRIGSGDRPCERVRVELFMMASGVKNEGFVLSR